jgi:hypothetical protein
MSLNAANIVVSVKKAEYLRAGIVYATVFYMWYQDFPYFLQPGDIVFRKFLLQD